MKNIIYILILIFLSSCTSNTIYKKPENLIPKDTMVTLLTDMYIALSAKNVKNINLERQVNYLPFVYAKYKIDSGRFNQSNVYYTSVIEEYNQILLEVKEKMESEHKKYADVLRAKDSIKNEEKKTFKKERLKTLKEEGKLNSVVEIDTLKLESKKTNFK